MHLYSAKCLMKHTVEHMCIIINAQSKAIKHWLSTYACMSPLVQPEFRFEFLVCHPRQLHEWLQERVLLGKSLGDEAQ